MKRPTLQNKQVGVLWTSFHAWKVSGTFEKRAPDPNFSVLFLTTALVALITAMIIYTEIFCQVEDQVLNNQW